MSTTGIPSDLSQVLGVLDTVNELRSIMDDRGRLADDAPDWDGKGPVTTLRLTINPIRVVLDGFATVDRWYDNCDDCLALTGHDGAALARYLANTSDSSAFSVAAQTCDQWRQADTLLDARTARLHITPGDLGHVEAHVTRQLTQLGYAVTDGHLGPTDGEMTDRRGEVTRLRGQVAELEYAIRHACDALRTGHQREAVADELEEATIRGVYVYNPLAVPTDMAERLGLGPYRRTPADDEPTTTPATSAGSPGISIA